MTTKNSLGREDDIHRLEAALGEFKQRGKVVSVKCGSCNELLEITAVGDAALIVKCPCGKCNDTLRGI